MQGTSEYPCKLMFPLHCHLYVQNFKETTREHTVWDGFIQTVNTQDMCVYNPTVRMTKMDQCVKRQTVFYQNFKSSTRGTAEDFGGTKFICR